MAVCTGCKRSPERNPSTVYTSSPATIGRNNRQLLTGWYAQVPARSFTITTAHAPHSPSAQPSFEPVRPRDRTKSSNVVCGGTSETVTSVPFRRKRKDRDAAGLSISLRVQIGVLIESHDPAPRRSIATQLLSARH